MAQSKRFSPMRYTAATEAAAVAGALDLVGATRDEADYEVLETSAKGVTVRVKPREVSAEAAPVTPAPTPDVPSATLKDELDPDSEIEAQLDVDETDMPTLEEENEALDEDVAAEDDEVDTDEDDLEGDEEDYEDDEDVELEVEEESLSVAASETEPEAEIEAEPEAEADEEVVAGARATAQEFLDKMGLEAICIYESGATASSIPLVVEGEDVGILIGKHGATLQAFQYLLNLTVNNASEPGGGVRVVVDAGNYRARRQNSLEQTARAAAQRARQSGRPVRLDAMPASERRIIHMFLQSETGITTQSEGREPQRRLVVFPATGAGAAPSNPSASGAGHTDDRGGAGRGMGGFNRGRGGRGFRR